MAEEVIKICADPYCREEWKKGDIVCPDCGCDEFDQMYYKDYRDMITGGLDDDA